MEIISNSNLSAGIDAQYFMKNMEGLGPILKKSDLIEEIPYLQRSKDYEKYGIFAVAPIGHDNPSTKAII